MRITGWGKGDVELTRDRFLDIWSEALDLDSKRMEAEGGLWKLASGAVVYSKVINFYKSEEYKNVLGRTTLIFDSNNIPVGFLDYYDFDGKKGARSVDAEVKTRMVDGPIIYFRDSQGSQYAIGILLYVPPNQ